MEDAGGANWDAAEPAGGEGKQHTALRAAEKKYQLHSEQKMSRRQVRWR